MTTAFWAEPEEVDEDMEGSKLRKQEVIRSQVRSDCVPRRRGPGRGLGKPNADTSTTWRATGQVALEGAKVWWEETQEG